MGKIKQLLAIHGQNEFCLVTKEGNYLPIQENGVGEIKSIISCLGKELFGQWPLSEENQKLMAKLTSIRFKPDKNGNSKKVNPKK